MSRNRIISFCTKPFFRRWILLCNIPTFSWCACWRVCDLWSKIVALIWRTWLESVGRCSSSTTKHYKAPPLAFWAAFSRLTINLSKSCASHGFIQTIKPVLFNSDYGASKSLIKPKPWTYPGLWKMMYLLDPIGTSHF